MPGLQFRAGNRSLIEPFRRRGSVILSPHRDDACFSLGGFLSAVGRGIVVNLFTRSRFIARLPLAAASEELVGPIRDREDRTFVERCGLVRHELDLPEPPVEGRRPFDASYIEPDVERLTTPLLSKLKEIGSTFQNGKAFLFCPIGIGGHANHLATFEAVMRNSEQIQGMYELLFYEDLPYAANPYKRFMGVAKFKQRIRTGVPSRNVYVPAWVEKKNLVDLYPSQVRRPWSRRRLRPFSLSPFEPHEAFWSIVGLGG